MVKSSSREASATRRGRTRVVWAATFVLLVLTAAALAQGGYGAGDAQANAAAEGTGVSAGVFTEAQATRGGEIFASRCSGCHGAQLQGGMGPQLNPINEAWHGMSLAALYRFVSQNMPFGAPGSIEPQQYADVISYVLSQNGFPTGEEELPPDADQLESLTIDAPPAQ